MKILRLRFKNISSLRGEWDIRFDAPPLSDTGLFAITGPNGAGKSSILDAITLGLYGETARLRHPERDITSWLEEESYAEVTFQVAEKVYRSRWWARQGPNGLLGPEMSLSLVNGTEKLLEDRVLRVRSRLSELTGLDFKRFCRSVLLAQGQFAAFLNALESERAEILEMIMGAEVAQDLAQELQHRTAAARERLLQLQERAASYPLVDRERQRELEQQRSERRAELDDLQAEMAQLEERKRRLETVERLHQELQQAQENLSAAEAQDQAAQQALQHMEALRGNEPVMEALRRFMTLEETRQGLQSRMDHLRQKSAEERKTLQELQNRWAMARSSLEEAQQQYAARLPDLEHAARKDREIQRHEQRLQEALARSMELERAHRDALARQDQIKAHLEETSARATSLAEKLDQDRTDAALAKDMVKIQELLERLARLREEEDSLAAQLPEAQKSLEKVATDLERARARHQRMQAKAGRAVLKKESLKQEIRALIGDKTPENLKEDIKKRKRYLSAYKKLLSISRRFHQQGLATDMEKAREKLRARRAKTLAALEEALAHIRLYEADITWRESFQRVSSERAMLQEGKPCPLCGSPTHPFVTEGLPDFSELHGRIDALQDRITALKAELSNMDTESIQLEKKAQAASQIHEEWQEVCRKAGLNVDLAEPHTLEETLRGLQEGLRHARSVLRSSRFKRWRVAWVDWTLRRRLRASSRDEEKRRRLEETYREHQEAVMKIQRSLEQLRGDAQAVAGDLQRFLPAYGERLPEKGQETPLLQRLHRRRLSYERAAQEQRDLAERIPSLKSQLEAIALNLARLEKEKEAAGMQVESLQSTLASMKAEREAIYLGRDAEAEQRSLEENLQRWSREQEELQGRMEELQQSLQATAKELLALETELQTSQKTYEALRKELEDSVRLIGLDSVTTALAAFKLLKDEPAFRDRVAHARENLTKARALVDAAQQAISAVGPVLEEGASAQELAERILDRHKRIESLQQELHDLEARLDRFHQSIQEHRELLQAVEDQERLLGELAAEEKAFREVQSAEAREKVRRAMLERLMEQANTHLELLSGRYRLRPMKDNGFGLVVEDLMHQRSQRSVRTLSGGETFVVSLSLALGLADLAAQHRKIESLFLDEGFGTLDEETLYRVIAALRRLQSNGKMVGIISHVKRLAEEIPTQIQVEREPGGMSRITVLP
ncbi:AAA family ATPase [Desulfosoma caldarium]|uniref:Exonuclease SbcC n=1 Tax=Desulfosoma caldarium TaxID=610254 RepID=A0A3N1UQT1_9BACT|nr:AAA family ATPase [Desulfosoma caldarium]ROQ93445.1 exonuclease SbcC [Desulfosoma caldarium]